MMNDGSQCAPPWRLGIAVTLFCLAMFGAGPAARAWQLTGNAKLPLLIPGFFAMLWMGWEAARYARLSGNATAATQAYMRRFVPLMALYVVLLIGAINVQRSVHPQGGFAVIVAILPALPLVGFVWAMGRLLIEETDEYQRMMHVRRALAATGFMLVVSTIWGFLETSGIVPHVPAWSAFILWNVGLLFAAFLPWTRR